MRLRLLPAFCAAGALIVGTFGYVSAQFTSPLPQKSQPAALKAAPNSVTKALAKKPAKQATKKAAEQTETKKSAEQPSGEKKAAAPATPAGGEKK